MPNTAVKALPSVAGTRRKRRAPYLQRWASLMQRIMRFTAFALTMTISALCSAVESGEVSQRGLILLDCSTFFGLLSQANSPYSDAMKTFSFSGVGYAQVLIQDPQIFEKEVGKSMVRTAKKFPLLQKEKEIFDKELQTCSSEIKLAEEGLRPGMSEAMKTLIPEIFSQNRSQIAQPTAPADAPKAARP